MLYLREGFHRKNKRKLVIVLINPYLDQNIQTSLWKVRDKLLEKWHPTVTRHLWWALKSSLGQYIQQIIQLLIINCIYSHISLHLYHQTHYIWATFQGIQSQPGRKLSPCSTTCKVFTPFQNSQGQRAFYCSDNPSWDVVINKIKLLHCYSTAYSPNVLKMYLYWFFRLFEI